MKPTWQSEDGRVKLWLGDCLEVMATWPDGAVDAVVTDPPYPSYYQKEYRYHDGLMDPLRSMTCRQFIFWTPSIPFPLDYGGKRIWDKRVGTNTQFEEIYERNGASGYHVHAAYSMGCFSSVSAQMVGETITGHPSQKPLKLLLALLVEISGRLIADPFMGSGTTGVAAVRLGRQFWGVEIDPGYFEVAKQRIVKAINQKKRSFDLKPKKLVKREPMFEMKKRKRKKKS